MANLTQTAYLTRKTIRYGSLFLVFFLVVRVIWGISTSIFRRVHPPAPPPPTISFGPLPEVEFIEKKNLPEISFKLETIQGTLPALKDVARVYFMPKEEAKLFSLEKTEEIARKMGFVGKPEQLSPTKVRFETGGTPKTTLEIDTATHNFQLEYDFVSDQQILAEKKLPSNEQAVSEAKNFLSRAGLLTPDLAEGKAEISYLKLRAPELIPAISLSEADFVRVDLFRKDLEDLPVLSPNPKEGLIFFLISGSRNQTKRIIRVHYVHFPVDEELSGTYPLKSPSAAWQELLGGEAFIAGLGNNQGGEIAIRKVYLAYFDSDRKQDFLQPIFVFEGDGGFFAYVPAIDPEWVE